ncbi:VWA domain-containing protein [Iodidimonas gelatinilytica]|uniref:VWA domain-containing protein n=1 Tax=Iodidimonas gelatinilytica TaxID=1236966 RepID=UPI0012314C54|nr:VWA domain-containing protein [Iodidimonas gelatinilytica]
MRQPRKSLETSRTTNAVDSRTAIDHFLNTIVKRPTNAPRTGRLAFALDATMSRQPTWDRASHIQSDMFLAAQDLGGLLVQLIYFRGFRECRASGWTDNGTALARKMASVTCQGGLTQIGRVLKHVQKEHHKAPVHAAIFIGDACEENADELCHLASELGIRHVPVFVFQEGRDPTATIAFKEIARLSGGAWAPFDMNSPAQLRDLLKAVAIYATGGQQALQDHYENTPARQRLLEQLKGPTP